MKKIDFSCVDGRYSLHNHTIFSDGADTPETMCLAGKKAGLQIMGISDHWCVPVEDGTDWREWCMAPEKFGEYIETLLALQKKYNDENFSLKIGLEVEFFPENIDSVIAELEKYPIDYLIGSVHFAGIFSIDHDIADWDGLSVEEMDNICNIYWQKIEKAAARREFAFIGHLDLPKKYNLIDNSKYFNNAVRVLDVLQKNAGAIEINTAGWFKECQEQYPSEEILTAAVRRSIPVYINADAHCASHVTRNFADAEKLIAKIRSFFNE